MFVKTRVKLELLHDLDMLNMIEKLQRGGLFLLGASVTLRPIANICQTRLKHKLSNYIIYQGADNLYGCSMCEKLHYKDLNWVIL